ncbi:MAG: helix-turn-helix domain-containing protein [Candidatus Berkelbacteria bacterium]|nr:helix-turn-helix domain-containing protein [Candidatus Berkelbacteria bacterium]
MINGFSKKKIETGPTLGDLFKQTRQKKEASFEDAELHTKIRAKYLEALESGNWENLPAPVYVRGFVLSYAKYLEIDKTEILKLFSEELSWRKTDRIQSFVYKNKLQPKKLLITPKLIGYAMMILAISSMFGYIYFEVQKFAGNPSLKIVSPGNNAIYDSDSIAIDGITDTDTFLKVNEENVPVTNDGHFEASMKLHRGVNVVVVKAVNKSKKETSQTLTIEYKPKTALIDTTQNQ